MLISIFKRTYRHFNSYFSAKIKFFPIIQQFFEKKYQKIFPRPNTKNLKKIRPKMPTIQRIIPKFAV